MAAERRNYTLLVSQATNSLNHLRNDPNIGRTAQRLCAPASWTLTVEDIGDRLRTTAASAHHRKHEGVALRLLYDRIHVAALPSIRALLTRVTSANASTRMTTAPEDMTTMSSTEKTTTASTSGGENSPKTRYVGRFSPARARRQPIIAATSGPRQWNPVRPLLAPLMAE